MLDSDRMGTMRWIRLSVAALLLTVIAGGGVSTGAPLRPRHAKTAAARQAPKRTDAESQPQSPPQPSTNPDQPRDTGGQTFITYSQKEKGPWDKAALVCEYLLIALGLGGLVVGALLLARMKAQSEAAAEAAKAALLHAESIVAAERAWLLIAPSCQPQDWSRDPGFHWVIRNVGKTPARLMETQARCEIVHSQEPLSAAPYFGDAVFLHDRMLAPGDELRLSTWWGVETERGYEPVANPAAMPRFSLLAYGAVTYLDAFDREHESRFCEQYLFDGGPDTSLHFEPRLDAPPGYTSHR